jgi:hypothetical protein
LETLRYIEETMDNEMEIHHYFIENGEKVYELPHKYTGKLIDSFGDNYRYLKGKIHCTDGVAVELALSTGKKKYFYFLQDVRLKQKTKIVLITS